MKFYRWTPNMSGPTLGWTLSEVKLTGLHDWQLYKGRRIDNWDLNNTAFYAEEGEHEDLACTTLNMAVHIYSERLRVLMEKLRIERIQYLPLRIQHLDSNREVHGYSVANYTCVIDALDRERSNHLLWGPDRPDRLGDFRDVKKAVLSLEQIGNARLFRLKGWEVMAVVREDVKRAIEEAGMTGCVFIEIEAY